MPVYFTTHSKTLNHFRVFKQSRRNIENSLAADLVTCSQKRQRLLCLQKWLFWSAATHQSHWRKSAPWCCLLSAHCHREDKPLALRRQNTLIFTKGYKLIKNECHVIAFSGQISWYLTADVCSVSVLQEPNRKLWSSRNGRGCSSETLVRADLLWCEYTIQQTDWRLPRSHTAQPGFFSCFLYILPVQGSVLAMQKGKRSRRCGLTGWKAIQCPDTGSA